MNAIIIGCGIGGLTAAIALQRVGNDVHVYERATELREVGAGISLWSNATHALGHLGLGEAVRARTLSSTNASIRSWRGERLSTITSEELEKRYGVAVALLHRADLLAMLLNEIPSKCVHLGHECTGFTQDAEGVTAQFTNGETARGDVLIGADGLRSVVRECLLHDGSPRYAGYTAWRCVVGFTRLGLAPSESWGAGRRFGIIPMSDGQVYWYATKNAPEGQQDPAGRTREYLKELFRGWHEPIQALLDTSQESSILRNDIYDREPVRCWSKDRVTLLGDAAHPMTPNLGQGGCQAIEDAVVLAAYLRTHRDVPDALRKYEKRRIARTSEIVLVSRRAGQMAQMENPLACYLRNAALRLMPKAASAKQLTAVAAYEALTKEEQLIFAAKN